jgi:hypothetical protein
MSFGITKTISLENGLESLEALYNGSLTEYQFRMIGRPTKLQVNDYVYTIFNDEIHGRLKITSMIGEITDHQTGAYHTLIVVEAPGERLDSPIPKKGHGGLHYYDGAEWPA